MLKFSFQTPGGVFRRIKPPLQREVAVCWWNRHAESSDPRVRERLAADWSYLARRRGNADAQTQIYYALFDRLARLPFEKLPSTETVRYLLRSLVRYPFVPAWEQMRRELSAEEGLERLTPAIWKPFHERERQWETRRSAAKVTFTEMYDVLMDLSSVFAFTAGGPPLPLAPTKSSLDALTAFTDGKTIHLPDAIAVSPHKILNEFAFTRLLLHEYLHIQLGHFRFSFRTRAGRNIWRKLAPRRDVFQRNRAEWDGRKTLERLIGAGEYVPENRKPALPHLLAFLMHFESDRQSGVHGFLNLLLDVMVEK